MDTEAFLEKIPYVYHLTDSRNVEFILSEKKIISTATLVEMSEIAERQHFLTTRRPEHETLQIGERLVYIRDQRPLNRALDRCLTDGWRREQFIAHLNARVFTWPNLKRLQIHFGRYRHEKPIILRITTRELLEKNQLPQLSIINSGATRPSGTLNGFAAFRGPNTFVTLDKYNSIASKIVEVTFLDYCHLPSEVEIGNSPDGPWKSVKV